ncbi:ATP-binding cassette domain-containing protein [Nonomuraea thailandensis]
MKARRPGEPGPADHTAPLLRVDELVVDLPRPDGDGRAVRVVDGVSFDVPAGTTVGLIGESGSGKTMTALAVIGLLPDRAATGGELVWRGGPAAAGHRLEAGPRPPDLDDLPGSAGRAEPQPDHRPAGG